MHRTIDVKASEPQDRKNTQLLIQRFEDDAKADDAYLYLGFQRRVRRLAQGNATDSFLGSDLMIEDFEGYNDRVSDMKWTYIGTRNVLLPMSNHEELKLATACLPRMMATNLKTAGASPIRTTICRSIRAPASVLFIVCLCG